MKINGARRRRAISPVLATVILIAITLIAAIAIAGFVFGLFGTFTSSARLQSSIVSCTHGGAGAGYCVIDVSNTGGASGTVTGCVLYGVAGVESAGASAPTLVAATVTIAAGVAAPGTPVGCTVNTGGTALTSGAAVSGSLTVASGSPLSFSAVAS